MALSRTAQTLRLASLAAIGLALAISAGCSKQSATASTAAPGAAPSAAPAAMPAHDMSAMAMPASDASAPDVKAVKVADFTLSDQNGKPHHLYDLKDKAAVVLIWQGVGCPIVQQMTPAIKDAHAKYGSKNIEFLMVNSNLQDTPEMIKAEADNFEIGMPVLKDADQKVGKNIGLQRTAEVVIIDPKKDWQVVYHGPLDDRLTYGRARAKADNNWASDTLDAMLAGKPVAYSYRPTDGCIVNLDS